MGGWSLTDETGAATSMVRLTEWSPKGERPVDSALFSPWNITTFLAGLRASGIFASLVLSGPIRREIFRAYTKQFLAPALTPGDVVVMDNLAAQRVAGVREVIEAAGASVLYLPPYSPHLNPIEKTFAKLKALLCKAAALTREERWDAIGRRIERFSPGERRNYIADCGCDDG